jgi:hypothetical protein
MFWLAPALAAVPIVSEDFSSTHIPLDGNDGWEAGWTDGWQESAGYASSTTDDGNLPGGTADATSFGNGTSADNWIVQTDAVAQDFLLEAKLLNLDDDAIGLVFRWTASDSFYLLVFTAGGMGPSEQGVDETFTGGRLYRVDSRKEGKEIAKTDVAPAQGIPTGVRIKADGRRISVWVDTDESGTYTASEEVIDVNDSDSLGAGNVGLYAYQDSLANFDSLTVTIEDRDLDGVENSRDDCPDAYDPAQTDSDHDGVGDACSDADKDGWLVTEGDCDDTDAAVHPGATEVWYDGKDEDCLGGDDFDQDGDLSDDPDDCDDLDPDIHPGATDVPYDGIDQDCADGDLDDVDGDGFPGGDAGTDCNDHDAAIHPGAGCDTVSDDVDADGFGAASDCDDSNAAIHPGATDIPDDGVDQNCTGEDAVDRLVGSGFGCSSTGVAPAWWMLAGLLLRRRR